MTTGGRIVVIFGGEMTWCEGFWTVSFLNLSAVSKRLFKVWSHWIYDLCIIVILQWKFYEKIVFHRYDIIWEGGKPKVTQLRSSRAITAPDWCQNVSFFPHTKNSHSTQTLPHPCVFCFGLGLKWTPFCFPLIINFPTLMPMVRWDGQGQSQFMRNPGLSQPSYSITPPTT